jgi:hypothetical protein
LSPRGYRCGVSRSNTADTHNHNDPATLTAIGKQRPIFFKKKPANGGHNHHSRLGEATVTLREPSNCMKILAHYRMRLRAIFHKIENKNTYPAWLIFHLPQFIIIFSNTI